ncbi:hypothetical protein KC19_9G074400 [Ceratodon purpureus]|uniref:Uncharacterized protein n=1 Tax=Ceratodon purpureus TaxID=3225 RepID=A0A8T0GPP3_CERPU|nr:hypothetical protein KC19_9G074400 [Ceratodon purpureus]
MTFNVSERVYFSVYSSILNTKQLSVHAINWRLVRMASSTKIPEKFLAPGIPWLL